MKDKMKAIVIGADHYNTLWVTRSLGNVGYYVIVILLSKTSNCYVCKSKHVGKHFVVFNENELINKLLEIKPDEKVSLYSTDDTVSEYIDAHFDLLKDKYFLPVCGEKQGLLSHWMNKNLMNKKANEVGFNIPWSRSLNLKDESLTNIKGLTFPCIIKPLKSIYGTKNDVRICHSEKELLEAQADLKNKCNHVILQQFLKPDYEITIDCVRFRKDNTVIIPGVILKERTCNSTFNLGMVAFASTDDNTEKYIDTSILISFLTEIDYDGLCSFDLLIKDGKTYFLEANLRTDGDMFIYTSSGINFPQLWDFRNRGIDITNLPKRIPKKTYGMIEISYIKYFPWNKPFTAIKEWWKTDCYSIFSWSDIKPFIYKFLYAIK